jgi:hypothetical protein
MTCRNSTTWSVTPFVTSSLNETSIAPTPVDQDTLNILFGTLGAVLAFAGIMVGYLQLRQYRRGSTRVASSPEGTSSCSFEMYVAPSTSSRTMQNLTGAASSSVTASTSQFHALPRTPLWSTWLNVCSQPRTTSHGLSSSNSAAHLVIRLRKNI